MSARLHQHEHHRSQVADPRIRRASHDESSGSCNGSVGSHSKAHHPKRNYKLLIDPAIKKGHQKVYRYDGEFPGQPTVVPRDPRPPKTKLWTSSQANLPLPRFKVDKYFVGPPPENTVRFSGLNDNIDRSFLKEMCLKFGKIEECKVYIDPSTNRRLGTGKVVFGNSHQAKAAVDELHMRSVMGDVIRAQLDKRKPMDSHGRHSHSEHHKHGRERHMSERGTHGGKHGSSKETHREGTSHAHIYPTPSPSNSSSVGSTPPLGNLGSNLRHHPVASRYNSSKVVPESMVQSTKTFPHSALTKSSYPYGSKVEPISPPPFRHEQPKDSPPPPPPPPPPSASYPSKPSQLMSAPPLPREKVKSYEDISPLVNFDDSTSSDRRSKQSKRQENSMVKTTEKSMPSYEAISDDEDANTSQNTELQLEDISAENSPADKQATETLGNADDNDDAMSLSSISSNEDVRLELNAPADIVCSSAIPTVSDSQPIIRIPPPFGFVAGLLPPVQPPPTVIPPPVIDVSRPPPLLPVNTRIPPPSLPPSIPPPPAVPPNFPPPSFQGFMGAVAPAAPLSYSKLRPPGTDPLPSFPAASLPFMEEPKTELPLNLKVKCGCTIEITEGLKTVLRKDVVKRLVEQSGFKALDSWWENQVKPKPDPKESPVKAPLRPTVISEMVPLQIPSSSGSISTTTTLISSLFGHGQSNGNAGHAALAKMPSFRISRKPHTASGLYSDRSSSHSQKRKLPSDRLDLSSSKLQRLDYSDDEEHDHDHDVTEGDSAAGLSRDTNGPTMRASLTGSALYQRVYTSSEDEEDSDSSLTSSSSDESDDDESYVRRQTDSSDEDMLSDTESQMSSQSDNDELTMDERMPDDEAMADVDHSIPEDEDIELDELQPKAAETSSMQEEDDVGSQHADEEEEPLPSPQHVQAEPVTVDVKSSTTSVHADQEIDIEGGSDAAGFYGDHTYFTATNTEEIPSESIPSPSVDDADLLSEKDSRGPPLAELQPKQRLAAKKSLFGDVLTEKIDKQRSPSPVEIKPSFVARTFEEEDLISARILHEGVDCEDVMFLRTAFESLQQCGSDVVAEMKWSDHPETIIPLPRQRRNKGESSLPQHKTGSARTEGFYKIPVHLKALYLKSVQKTLELKTVEEDKDGTKHRQQSREHRATQRRLVSSIEKTDYGDLLKFNQLKTRKKHLRFAKSSIHDWGLFACEPIAAEEMVIEYVGDVIRSHVADSREKRYEETGIGSSYLFRLDSDTVIDATKCGNNARFINHCCTPNCYAKVIILESQKRIVIYSKVDIKTNDEITYDYKFPLEDEKIPCLCGTPQCRGTLN